MGKGMGDCHSFQLQLHLHPGVEDLAVLMNLTATMHHKALLPLSCKSLLSNIWGSDF